MKIYILIISSIFFSNYTLASQTKVLKYDLIVAGKSIGTVIATKTIDGNITTYTSNTDAIAKFIFTTEIKTRMTVIYENGVLQSSDYKLYKNGDLDEYASLKLCNGKYLFNHDGEKNELNEKIKQSTVVLPFEEPKKNTAYFEEIDGFYKEIVVKDRSTFTLINSINNNSGDYFYKDGIMQKCLIRNTIVNFTMQLKS